jgi:hypothetical protein
VQKVLLAIKSMGGESTEACRAVLDDLIQRGLRRPEFLIVDGAPGVCTENSVLIDYVTESPNVSGDDRSVMLLPDPVASPCAQLA